LHERNARAAFVDSKLFVEFVTASAADSKGTVRIRHRLQVRHCPVSLHACTVEINAFSVDVAHVPDPTATTEAEFSTKERRDLPTPTPPPEAQIFQLESNPLEQERDHGSNLRMNSWCFSNSLAQCLCASVLPAQ